MWLWIKRWRDWAMNDLWPLYRISPQPQALHYSYEKAGLTLHDQPIPWNAEAVLVEALLRLPPGASRRKGDFLLRLPGQQPVPAEQLRRQEGDERYAIHFRLPPPAATAAAEILYRNHVLGQLTLPFLSRDEFLQNLRLQLPTLFVRIGAENVACQTFVASQCRGLLASAVLLSPTSLVAAARPGPAGRVPLRARRRGPPDAGPAVQLAAGRPAGARRRHAAAAPAAHRGVDGDLAARRPAAGDASACGPFRSTTSSARCASPTRASWCRPPTGRCGWPARRRRWKGRRGWVRASW